MPSIIKIIISMVIWGSIGIFVKNINLPSVELAFLRAVIASTVLALVYPMFKSQRDSENLKENILLLILSGGAIGANWILLFKAYNYTTISNATLSYYFAPVFVILLSPVVFKEKLTKSRLIAAAGAMIGLFLIVNNQSQASVSSPNHLKGIAFGLMAAGLYGSVVLLNKYIKGISGYMMTLIQISTSALVLLPFIIYRSALTITNLKNLLLIAVLGIVHTGLAYLLYFSGIKELEVQRAAILSYIDPIAAIIFGTIFLAEPLNLYQIIGGFLILGSTFIGER
ncbi:DMT family transporter [Fonticella tunisiensis]|uniref:RarD protein n=1 Tax=Fonticella tunisiensis TaxID=1096341 RepID=A0A4R7KTG4_9CLOT|nr:DMT family transporter [Fonticella tunisiensis]TDT63293.1 RarD protein [Fonticella tunisiensis]